MVMLESLYSCFRISHSNCDPAIGWQLQATTDELQTVAQVFGLNPVRVKASSHCVLVDYILENFKLTIGFGGHEPPKPAVNCILAEMQLPRTGQDSAGGKS